jgi:hypothetical protein
MTISIAPWVQFRDAQQEMLEFGSLPSILMTRVARSMKPQTSPPLCEFAHMASEASQHSPREIFIAEPAHQMLAPGIIVAAAAVKLHFRDVRERAVAAVRFFRFLLRPPVVGGASFAGRGGAGSPRRYTPGSRQARGPLPRPGRPSAGEHHLLPAPRGRQSL